ncbi:DUF4268 domain-containing protein [Gloeocapsopsis sp. IPPAS B-1203]|uniref:DUF4268 domain-containing protein n=1 Tax=Gloeocapsopsis sp. IPPAS B-1203 TaxID=2049454 RepID=UPI000C191BA6|nr:DUF4268 domain-containing protein [Gloeocapsopsis sp. IPPAS B-1203]PIG92281.1 hypothetical protein CSQ79_16765 [Gloeocapsopsis sp. IPPAS B-1203]
MPLTNKPLLGRLEKVDPRTYWEREDIDFTPWLALTENIQILGDTIAIELEVEAQEKGVGLFRADILCKDTATDHWVLIENQLERTDHIHLGQLLTYAAGLNAVTIVWVAKRFTEEHRAALDWLNEITDEEFNFFGLEIELWQIGDSAIAPKFNIVCQPNDWSKRITGVTKILQTSNPSKTRQLQYEYWAAFQDFALTHATLIKPTRPLYQHWMNIALGRSGFGLCAVAIVASAVDSETQSYANNEIRAEVVISREAKAFFALLESQKTEIEAEFGEPLTWYNNLEVKSCRVYLRRAANLNAKDKWAEQHQWLVEKLDRLYKVFSHRVKQLSLDSAIATTIPSEPL